VHHNTRINHVKALATHAQPVRTSPRKRSRVEAAPAAAAAASSAVTDCEYSDNGGGAAYDAYDYREHPEPHSSDESNPSHASGSHAGDSEDLEVEASGQQCSHTFITCAHAWALFTVAHPSLVVVAFVAPQLPLPAIDRTTTTKRWRRTKSRRMTLCSRATSDAAHHRLVQFSWTPMRSLLVTLAYNV
jgi:hypothetical protein